MKTIHNCERAYADLQQPVITNWTFHRESMTLYSQMVLNDYMTLKSMDFKHQVTTVWKDSNDLSQYIFTLLSTSVSKLSN